MIGPQFRFDLDTHDVVPLVKRVVVEASACGGPALGADGGFAWQVDANVAAYVTECASLYFGYRLRGGTFESGPFELQGSLQGLVVGATFRF